jgi:hypothetical protein
MKRKQAAAIPERQILIRGRDALLFLICLAAAFIIFLSEAHEFNHILLILPVVYGFCYVLILAPLKKKTGSKTVFWFSVAEFIRMVFVPCYEAVNEYVGFYGFSTQDQPLILRSVLLMAYECVFISLFLLLVLRRRGGKVREEREELQPLGRDVIALLVVLLLGIGIYLSVPAVNRTLNFLQLETNAEKIRALTTGSQSSLTVGLITFTYDAFLCGFIIALDYAKKKYDITGKRLYVLMAAFAGLIVVGIINGESRSTIVCTSYATVQCLGLCFEKHRTVITRAVVFGGGVVLLGMTVYRLFSAYRYSTYGAAIQEGALRDNYFSAFFEMYCLGPQSVACGLQFSDLMRGDFTIGTFLYDFFRPFMGLNFIAKLFDSTTSIMMYNSWFSGVQGKSNGIFLQITNQGYCYLGFWLAPLYACVFLKIATVIEKRLEGTKNIFLVFFYNYVYFRLATCVIAGTMSGYITTITMVLIMAGAIYLLQKLVSATVGRME